LKLSKTAPILILKVLMILATMMMETAFIRKMEVLEAIITTITAETVLQIPPRLPLLTLMPLETQMEKQNPLCIQAKVVQWDLHKDHQAEARAAHQSTSTRPLP